MNTFYSGKFFFKFQSENIELNAQLIRTVFHLHFVKLLGSHLLRRIRRDHGKEGRLRGRPAWGPQRGPGVSFGHLETLTRGASSCGLSWRSGPRALIGQVVASQVIAKTSSGLHF